MVYQQTPGRAEINTSHPDQAIAAIATAPGLGAIGIVRVSGSRLEALLPSLGVHLPSPRVAKLTTIRDATGEAIDQALVLYFPAPHSFTGEDIIEIQSHGGAVAMQMILSRLLELSASIGIAVRLANPGEFSQRAFLNDKIDLAQAEAIADLIGATSEAAVKSANRSLSGAFSNEINHLLEGLIALRMLVEVSLDFPEEELEHLERGKATERLQIIQKQLQKTLTETEQGSILREGVRVVIAGQPNAGKSALLNLLAGAEVAIVTPIAGTTRDKIEQQIHIDSVPLHIIDTAGLRQTSEVVERIGIERAWAEIDTADLLLFVHDSSQVGNAEYDALDLEIEARLPKTIARIDVWNKSDLCKLDKTTGVHLSCQTQEGLSALRSSILAAAGWRGNSEGLYTARKRHVLALHEVEAHLGAGSQILNQGQANLDLLAEELRLAQNALNAITGAFSADDLLGVIFSQFCIGK